MGTDSPLTVAFNARSLCDPRIRGFNRYFLALLREIRRLEPGLPVRLFSDRPLSAVHSESVEGWPFHRSRLRPHLAWEQLALPLQAAARIAGPGILHAPANVGIPARFLPRRIRKVVTLHDLMSFHQIRKAVRLSHASRGVRIRELKGIASFMASWRALETADAVITVSRYSRFEILKEFPAWAPRLHVIPNGIDARFSPGEADADTLARFGLRPPYVLYVGGFERRKNVAMIAEAWRALELPEARRPQVALVGTEETALAELKKAFEPLGPAAHWLGYVRDADLAQLYRGAACVVVPSRDEGFGLPLAEAMASGAPALSSDAASLPEVGGDAPAYFSPDEPGELARLIEKACADAGWAAAARERGLRRARELSWESSARRTLELYRELLRAQPSND